MNISARNSSLLNETFFTNTSLPGRNFVAPWLIVIPESQRIAFYVSLSLVLLLSVVGNAYIIAVVLRNKRMHSNVIYLIVNMAFFDLAGSIAMVLPTLSRLHTLSFEWRVSGTLGNILCKACPFLGDVSIAVSILSMVVIGFDRFFAVVYPMRLTPRFLKTCITLPAIWFIAMGTFVINLFTYQLIPIFGSVNMCIRKWPASFDPIQATTTLYLIILICYFVVPLIVIALLYLAIGCSLKRHNHNLIRQQSMEFEKRRRKQNLVINRMSFTIVACFFACWFPFHIVSFLYIFIWKGTVPAPISPDFGLLNKCTTVISYVSFFANPFICFIFSSNYRKYLRKTFPLILFFSHRNETEQKRKKSQEQRTNV